MTKRTFIKILFALCCVPLLAQCTPSSVKDKDGNSYKLVKIGKQVWMAENLKTKIKSEWWEGEAFLQADDKDPKTGKMIEVMLDRSFQSVYRDGFNGYPDNGRFYAVDIAEMPNICPEGFHIPYAYEWNELIKFLGENPAIKLKSKTGWLDGLPGTDEVGFNALPLGNNWQGSEGYWTCHREDVEKDIQKNKEKYLKQTYNGHPVFYAGDGNKGYFTSFWINSFDPKKGWGLLQICNDSLVGHTTTSSANVRCIKDDKEYQEITKLLRELRFINKNHVPYTNENINWFPSIENRKNIIDFYRKHKVINEETIKKLQEISEECGEHLDGICRKVGEAFYAPLFATKYFSGFRTLDEIDKKWLDRAYEEIDSQYKRIVGGDNSGIVVPEVIF